MADPAPAPPPPGAPKEENKSWFNKDLIGTLIRAYLLFSVVGYLSGPSSPFRSKPAVPAASEVTSTPSNPATNVDQQAVKSSSQNKAGFVSLWPSSTLLDVSFKLSTDEGGNVDFEDSSLPSITWDSVPYTGSWSYIWDTEINLPDSVMNNGSMWLDIFVTRAGTSPNPKHETYDQQTTMHIRKLLTRYMPKARKITVKNLMASKEKEDEIENEKPAEEEEKRPIISYYHPNLTIEMIPDAGPIPRNDLPPALQQWVPIAFPGVLDKQGRGLHFPITWPNDFWLLRQHMYPINETTPVLPLHVEFKTTSMWKFQILCSMDENFQKEMAAGKPGDLDIIKQTLLDNNPILLITTAVVSMLHMLFEMLAFTSDVSHWRNKKDQVGVSVRTILTNVFIQLVVLLYLLDNNEDTSWMILLSQGMGLLIEAWKINKTLEIRLVQTPDNFLGYKLDIRDKHVLSEEELKTKEYDAMAFKWVGMGTAPFLVGYTIYSMMYKEHKGWYSFIISTLTSFVYLFGFVQLIPQLLINWKLKSVAHMPMKTMMYKFFATIVDDFFSFVIKMPLLHRIACFRDDVVFLILLYQMWIYKVDPTRENEYGQKLTEEEAEKLLLKQKSEEGTKGKESKTKDKSADKDTESKKNK